MAARGRPASAKTKAKRAAERDFTCSCCGETKKESMFYFSNSAIYKTNRLPICRECVGFMYKHYVKKYQEERHMQPEKDAIRRVCMGLDIYYSDRLYESAVAAFQGSNCSLLIMQYFKTQQLQQYRNKTYDITMFEEEQENRPDGGESDGKNEVVSIETIKFFGRGFTNEEYIFLKEQYDDWTARHECKDKAQEEIFKRLCFKQLELWRASVAGEDTKNLDKTFNELLASAKLQPKQNSGETTSESQTFGTLIDKWENTRPIPEADDDFKDVDNVALYIDTFFRGHTCKMLEVKNSYSALYDKVIKDYTVQKPEYSSEENSEVIFDAMFGNKELT